MEEKVYSVSEAVRLVGVESHVLRYWEEELQVEIRRTSQGHRIYSERNIETFCRVRELKDRGLQLRAIRVLLDESQGDIAKAALTEQISEIGNRVIRTAEESDCGGQTVSECAVTDSTTSAGNENQHSADYGISDESDEVQQCADITESGMPDQENCSADKCGENEESEPVDGSCVPLEVFNQPTSAEQPEQNQDNLKQFETILKSLMFEIMEEQNRMQEQHLREIVREEMDQIFASYGGTVHDAMREAAVDRGILSEEKGFFAAWRRLWHRRKSPEK